MKKLRVLFFCLLLVIISCNKSSDNELQGDTNVPLNQVGNTFSTTTYVNGEYVEIPGSCVISKSENGVAKLDVVIDLTQIPGMQKINDLIPDIYKDQQGRLNTQAQVKITSEGIQDYTNADGKAFTMVKYDCKVGDKYTCEKSDGNTITRTVTAKSDQDDFPYGFYYIKTTTVEQDSRIPGISKITYRFNHKFGLVFVEATAEDGSTFSSYVFPQNY